MLANRDLPAELADMINQLDNELHEVRKKRRSVKSPVKQRIEDKNTLANTTMNSKFIEPEEVFDDPVEYQPPTTSNSMPSETSLKVVKSTKKIASSSKKKQTIGKKSKDPKLFNLMQFYKKKKQDFF